MNSFSTPVSYVRFRVFALFLTLVMVLGLSAIVIPANAQESVPLTTTGVTAPQQITGTSFGNNLYERVVTATVNESGTITGIGHTVTNTGNTVNRVAEIVTVDGQTVYQRNTANSTSGAETFPNGSFSLTGANGLNLQVNAGSTVSITYHFHGSYANVAALQLGDITATGTTVEPTEVTPTAPVALAEECGKTKKVLVPPIDGVKYAQTQSGNIVTVTATPKPGFKFRAGAETRWTFDISPDATCNTSDSTFKVTPHNGVQITEPQTTGDSPTYTTTFVVKEDSFFQRMFVKIKRLNGTLDFSEYTFKIDGFAEGTTLKPRIISENPNEAEIELIPVAADGTTLYSVSVLGGTTVSMVSDFTDPKTRIEANIDIYATSKEATKFTPEFVDADESFIHSQVQNPPLPQRCGLRVAIVADLSRSINHAEQELVEKKYFDGTVTVQVEEPIGYKKMREAAIGLLDSIKGNPVEVGIYNFGTHGPGNTQDPSWGTTANGESEHLSVAEEENYQKLVDKINDWDRLPIDSDATNWEAGLKQLQGKNYDVVYFITDGAPTVSDDSTSIAAHTHLSDLNRAIDAANALKQSGTRIETLLVDFWIGKTEETTSKLTEEIILHDGVTPMPVDPVTKDLALTGLKPNSFYIAFINGSQAVNFPAYYYKSNILASLYKELKVASQNVYVLKSDARGNVSYERGYNYARRDGGWGEWTYGVRSLEKMAKDISANDAFTSISNYAGLVTKMKEIGDSIATNCEGKIVVKKRIVDRKGDVVTDGASGWEFNLTTSNPVIDKGVQGLVRRDWQETATQKSDEPGTVNWILQDKPGSITIQEAQQSGYSLYKRNQPTSLSNNVFTYGVNKRDGSQGDFNAVCTQTLNGEKTFAKVTNNGVSGFNVEVAQPEKEGQPLATVYCVVDNMEAKPTPDRKVKIKKVGYKEGETELKGAEFTIYGKGKLRDIDLDKVIATAVNGEFTIAETGTYYLVETKSPAGYNLLAREVRLDVTEENGKLKMSVDTASAGDLVKVSEEEDSTGNKIIVLTVADTKTGELPKTGGMGIWGFAAAGLLICGVAAAVAVRRK